MILLALGFAVAPGQASEHAPEKSRLVVAISEKMPPLYFVDEESGEPRGFGVDVIRAVAENAEFDLTFAIYATPAEALAAVRAGEADIIPSAGIPPRQNATPSDYLYTTPFHIFRVSLFVRDGYAGDTNLRSFPPGNLGACDRPMIRRFFESQSVEGPVPFATAEAGILALLSSEIDGYVLPEEFLRYVARQWGVEDHFRDAGPPLFEVKRAILVRNGLPGVHRALDAEIKAFARTGKFSRLYTTWFGALMAGFPFIPVLSAFFAALFVVGAGVFFWRHRLLVTANLNLEQVVHERTESLRQQIVERDAAERELLRAKETLEERVQERTEELCREMDERVRAERELQETEQRYQTIVHGSRVVMLLIDPESGAIVDANPSACEFYGYARSQLTRMKVWDINVRPEEEVRARMSEALTQTRTRFLFDHRLASGEIRHIDGRPTPVDIGGKKYIFSIVVDVTDQVRAETALRENERLLTAILDNSPAVIHLKDREGRYLLANARFLDLHGLTAEQVIGNTSHEFLPSDFALEGVQRDEEVLREGTAVSYESLLMPDEGPERHILSVKFPVLDTSGEIFAVGTISNDITEYKQTEIALRHSQRLESIGQLTGGVAHDFNNMLGVIIMNLEYLRDVVGGLPETAFPALDAIEKAAWRGADLTKRLLAFSRKSNRSVTTVNANELLASMQEMLERTLTESIEIEINASADLWSIEVEEGDLGDAILNLAINSRDAMPHGGKLTITTKNVTLGNDWFSNNPDLAPGEYVFLEVADNGPGMSEDILERVFEPFFTTKPTGEGTGLGLSMVYGFVRRSKGDVRISSSPWDGTRVQFLFPRSVRHLAETGDDVSGTSRPRGSERILVVDDEAAIRNIVCHQLGDLGYQTTAAENGARALEILQDDGAIDLLLCDIVMPGGLSGDQVAVQARRLRPDLKIILISGYTKDLDEINRAGVTDGDVLLKPFAAAELARRIRQALDEKPSVLAG